MEQPQKGMSVKLEHSKSARQRICVGISWDAEEEEIERPDLYRPSEEISSVTEGFKNPYSYDLKPEIGKVTGTFDLDLVCLIFNEQNELVDAVSPMEGEEVDLSGKIYHSGDEQNGATKGDDEIIYIELKDIPEYVHQLVFIAIIQSGHSFGQIVNPEARIYDSMTGDEFLNVEMVDRNFPNATAYIFSRVFLENGEWQLHNIDEYRIDTEIEDWGEEIKRTIFS